MFGLVPGQRLYWKKRSEMLPSDAALLDRLRIERNVEVRVTHVDAQGVSFRINRSPGNIDAFMPRQGVGMVQLSTFFELGQQINPSCADPKGRHFTKVFPRDFI